MIKVKFKKIVDGKGNLNLAMATFLGIPLFDGNSNVVQVGFSPKSAALRYDIQTKLGGEIQKEQKNFQKLYNEYQEELAEETEYKDADGKKQKTKFILEVIDKKETPKEGEYNLTKEMKNEFDKRIDELLEIEVELNCHQIKLSKLENEGDTSQYNLNFAFLEPFINNDLSED